MDSIKRQVFRPPPPQPLPKKKKSQKKRSGINIRWNHECIWLLLISDSLFIWYLSKDIVVGKFYVKSVTKS